MSPSTVKLIDQIGLWLPVLALLVLIALPVSYWLFGKIRQIVATIDFARIARTVVAACLFAWICLVRQDERLLDYYFRALPSPFQPFVQDWLLHTTVVWSSRLLLLIILLRFIDWNDHRKSKGFQWPLLRHLYIAEGWAPGILLLFLVCHIEQHMLTIFFREWWPRRGSTLTEFAFWCACIAVWFATAHYLIIERIRKIEQGWGGALTLFGFFVKRLQRGNGSYVLLPGMEIVLLEVRTRVSHFGFREDGQHVGIEIYDQDGVKATVHGAVEWDPYDYAEVIINGTKTIHQRQEEAAHEAIQDFAAQRTIKKMQAERDQMRCIMTVNGTQRTVSLLDRLKEDGEEMGIKVLTIKLNQIAPAKALEDAWIQQAVEKAHQERDKTEAETFATIFATLVGKGMDEKRAETVALIMTNKIKDPDYKRHDFNVEGLDLRRLREFNLSAFGSRGGGGGGGGSRPPRGKKEKRHRR